MTYRSEIKPYAVCEADAPVCGHCGRVLRGVHVKSGTTLQRCGHQRCKGANYIVAGAEGTCTVYPVSVERAREIAADDRPARDILAGLGFLTRSITYREAQPA